MSSVPSESTAHGDAWLAAFFLAVFAGMAALAFDYPGAARTLPLLVGGLGATLSAWELLRAYRRARQNDGATRGLPRRHVVMCAWLAGAIGSVAVAGILLGGVAFVGAFLYIQAGERLSSAALGALMLAAVLHLTIERGLGLYLFGGLLFR